MTVEERLEGLVKEWGEITINNYGSGRWIICKQTSHDGLPLRSFSGKTLGECLDKISTGKIECYSCPNLFNEDELKRDYCPKCYDELVREN